MQRRFVYGNYIDEVLLMTDGGGNDHYYVHDHLYSPVALLEDVGSRFNIIERYEYDAYGYVTMFDGDFTPITGSAASNPYYFTGRRLDLMDGGNYELMYYRNRTYDPQTGRFLQPDPLGYIDGMNLYEYVGSNPVMALDPMGLSSLYQETFPIWDRYRFENG